MRVRLLFTAGEERGYLGPARGCAPRRADVAGVLSLELCGIGDSLAVWDAARRRRSCPRVRRARGPRPSADESYHVVGRIPVFGSDHRAFAAAGAPAYGLTSVPAAAAPRPARVRLHPVRATLRGARPPAPAVRHVPHRARPRGDLDTTALDRVTRALEAVVGALGGPPPASRSTAARGFAGRDQHDASPWAPTVNGCTEWARRDRRNAGMPSLSSRLFTTTASA